MISKIKNRHLRRLAVIGWSLLCFTALPFMAIADSVTTFVPSFLSEWWYSAYKVANANVVAALCPICKEENDDYWYERWEDFYRDCL